MQNPPSPTKFGAHRAFLISRGLMAYEFIHIFLSPNTHAVKDESACGEKTNLNQDEGKDAPRLEGSKANLPQPSIGHPHDPDGNGSQNSASGKWGDFKSALLKPVKVPSVGSTTRQNSVNFGKKILGRTNSDSGLVTSASWNLSERCANVIYLILLISPHPDDGLRISF